MQVTFFTFIIILVSPPALISVGEHLKIVCELKLYFMYEHLFQQKGGSVVHVQLIFAFTPFSLLFPLPQE
jgi:hypothetical protein